jgi:chemotaxis protein methyltransferase CheR
VHEIPDSAQLAELADLLDKRLGIHFAERRWRELERALAAAAGELGYPNVGSCLQGLLSAPLGRRELEILASHLTVGETYFFREPETYRLLETRILPALTREKRGGYRSLRFWSAGCATGEEAYSLAILLREQLPDLQDWNVTILATDINPRFLRKAAEGVYTEWSFRGVPARIRESYFTNAGQGRCRISSDIRRMVAFSYLNLVEDPYPALTSGTNAMDLILCRNVLMYFDTARMRRVIDGLHNCLVDGGWLVVSAVETSASLYQAFETTCWQGVTVYRRRSSSGARPSAPGAPPVTAVESTDLAALASAAPAPDLPPIERPVDLVSEAAAAASTAATPDPREAAKALFRRGLYAEATEQLGPALARDHSDPQAMSMMARALANQGRLHDATEWCERAIAADKLNAEHRLLLAGIQQERGQSNEAELSLKHALYLDPELALAHFALGNIARRAGRLAESDRHFANALSSLEGHGAEDVLPEPDGITAGRLREIIEAVTGARPAP